MISSQSLPLKSDASNLSGTNTLLGGVMILPNQLVHIFDERTKNGCVRLVCKDPHKMDHMFWQYLVMTYNKTAPVATSNVTIRDKDTNVVAFAVGKRVFLVRFRYASPIYDSVEKISSLKIDDVAAGSWISSITGHHSFEEEKFDFVMTISVENEIRGCRVTGEIVRYVNPQRQLSSVRNIASSSGNLIALICDEVSDVRLTSFDVTFKDSGYLKPIRQMKGQRAKSVLWTGSMWIVLWVGQDRRWVWMVASYKETGEFSRICLPLSAVKDGKSPVCLARFGNTGIVNFEDNAIEIFKF